MENNKPVAVLWQTPIAKQINGEFEVNSGGYRTTTTKERLNALIKPTGHRIEQRKCKSADLQCSRSGANKDKWIVIDDEGHESDYHDGMKFPMKQASQDCGLRTTETKPARKYINVIQGNYGSGWEDVTEEDKYFDAEQRLKEYRENEPQYAHRRIVRKVIQ
jgi:hypothetical protein